LPSKHRQCPRPQKERAFIATCEATSRYQKEELYYRFDYHLWVPDNLAVGLFIALGVFIYAQIAPDWFPEFLHPLFVSPFEKHQAGMLLTLALGLTLSSGFISALITRYNKRFNIRYRYIHALRQFKQYAADEQWAAFSQDVFAEAETKTKKETYWKENKYYKELYRQALNAGVGLLLINENQAVTPIITPKRKTTKIKDLSRKKTWQKLTTTAPLQKAKEKTKALG